MYKKQQMCELFSPYYRYCVEQAACQQYCKQQDRENQIFKAYLAVSSFSILIFFKFNLYLQFSHKILFNPVQTHCTHFYMNHFVLKSVCLSVSHIFFENSKTTFSKFKTTLLGKTTFYSANFFHNFSEVICSLRIFQFLWVDILYKKITGKDSLYFFSPEVVLIHFVLQYLETSISRTFQITSATKVYRFDGRLVLVS